MSAENWPTSLKIILREEGGNDDDPRDRGGRTSRGITQNEWDIFRHSHPDRPADVWQAPQADIEEIYRLQYWNPYCDQLPGGVDLEFFNASVNSGRTQAVREMQRSLGVAVDGMVGIETMGAAQRPQDYKLLVQKMADQRRAFYRQNRQFKIYGRGWMARTDRVEQAALGMAPVVDPATIASNFSLVTQAGATEALSAKAMPEDTGHTPIGVGTATSATAASGGGAAVVDQIQQVTNQLSPLQYTLKWVSIILAILAVVSACFAIYAIIKKNRAEEVT